MADTKSGGAMAASTLVKEGWLMKADPSGSHWKNRWCVLIPSAFFYYADHDKKDANLKGSFELAEARMGVGWPLAKKLTTDKHFVFHLSLPGRTYYFAASTQAQMNDWIATIERTLAHLQQRNADGAFVGLDGEEEDEYLTEDGYDPRDANGGVYTTSGPSGGRGGGSGRMGAMPAIVESPYENHTSASVDEEAIAQAAGALPHGLRSGVGGGRRGVSTFKESLAARYHNAATGGQGTQGGGEEGADDGGSTATRERPPSPHDSAPASTTSSADNVTFHVLVSAQGGEPEKKFVMSIRTDRRATVTMGQLKRKLAAATGRPLSELRLTFDGDEGFELEDSFTALDVDLGPDLPLRLSFTANAGGVGDDSFQPEEEEEEEGVASAPTPPSPTRPAPAQSALAPTGTSVATSAPPAAAAGGKSVGFRAQPERAAPPSRPDSADEAEEGEGEVEGAVVPQRRMMERQLTSADDASPVGPQGARGPALPTGFHPHALAARGDKHAILLRVFNATAEGDAFGAYAPSSAAAEYPLEGPVSPTDLAAALAADPDVAGWREYEDLIRQLITQPGGASITWERLLELFRRIQAHADAVEGAAATAAQALKAATAAAAATAATASAVPSTRVPTASTPRSQSQTQATPVPLPVPVPVSQPTSADNAPARPSVAVPTAQPPQSRGSTAAVPAPAPAPQPQPQAQAPQLTIPQPVLPAENTGSNRAALPARPSQAPAPVQTAPATAAAAPVPTPQAQPQPGHRQKHVMVMTVDIPDHGAEDINVCVGNDPDALAADFVRLHNLNAAHFHRPLAEEIRKTLLEAYALELADALAGREAAERRPQLAAPAATPTPAPAPVALEAATAGVGVGVASGSSATAKAVADLEARNAALISELAALRIDYANAKLEGSRAAETAAASSAEVRQLHALLTEATKEVEVLRGQVVSQEDTQRKNVWDRFVDGGEASILGSPSKARQAGSPLQHSSSGALGVAVAAATASFGDWRTWAAEKREILSRSNADRASLIEENKRLRASLDIRGVEAEARLRGADEDRARLSSEVHTLSSARNRAEAELRSVYKQWEEDGRRWATERKHLSEQLESLLASAMQASFPAHTLGMSDPSARESAQEEEYKRDAAARYRL